MTAFLIGLACLAGTQLLGRLLIAIGHRLEQRAQAAHAAAGAIAAWQAQQAAIAAQRAAQARPGRGGVIDLKAGPDGVFRA